MWREQPVRAGQIKLVGRIQFTPKGYITDFREGLLYELIESIEK